MITPPLRNDFSTTLEAECSRVFAALSTADELRRWFAEDVSIDPREGGFFHFAGRGAYAPTSARITRFEPGRTLSFTYPLHDVAGEVTWSLSSEKPGETKLEVHHAFEGALPIPRAQELVDDLWRLACGNLAAHLRGGRGVLLPDFSAAQPEVRLSIFIDAPPARVFRALIDPEQINAWVGMGLTAVVDPQVGGRYWWTTGNDEPMTGGPTRILELLQDERLVLEWPDWRGDAALPKQRVAWTLTPEDQGTRLLLVHDGFTRSADISDFPSGWSGFLDRLRAVSLDQNPDA